MLKLDATQSMAKMGLNALIIGAIERDALVEASIMLERASPDTTPSDEALIREANQILPSASDNAGCLRIFWSTKRELEDSPYNELADLATFISTRAETLETLSVQMLKESKSPQAWTQSLARLAEAYSYVLEAAMGLEERGLIPLRRKAEFETLTSMPDPDVNYSGSLLHMKALALYTSRLDDETQSLREQYR